LKVIEQNPCGCNKPNAGQLADKHIHVKSLQQKWVSHDAAGEVHRGTVGDGPPALTFTTGQRG
jgi:hypothetical protein